MDTIYTGLGTTLEEATQNFQNDLTACGISLGPGVPLEYKVGARQDSEPVWGDARPTYAEALASFTENNTPHPTLVAITYTSKSTKPTGQGPCRSTRDSSITHLF